MKINMKMIIKGIIWIAVLGGFFGLLVYLGKASTVTEKNEVTWEPDAKTEAEETWELVAENEAMELYFDPGRVQIMVTDKRTGTEWRSNPVNAEKDKIAYGQNKSAVRSLIDVSYVDEQGSFYSVNNFMESVKNDTYTYEYRDDGVYVNFQFDKQDFEIPCFFGIEEDRFVARVLCDDIKQHGIHKVSSIALLPYFGAGSMEEEGYMVVPDGAGALIRFNNQKQTYRSYVQRVYGRDLAVNQQSYLLREQSATMPVFGIKKSQDAFLAVITEGEFQAEIRADVSRKITSNNAVYSSVIFIQAENNTLVANGNEIATMLSPQDKGFPCYEVSYFFLEKDAGYSEMALRYQRYLMEEMGMRENAEARKSINLSFIGGIMTDKTFLGVPYQAVEALSPFSEVNLVLTELAAEGKDDFLVSMTEVAAGGTKSKMPVKITFERALGGKKGYMELEESLSSLGIPLYLVYNPVNIRKTGNGYTSYDAARNVIQSVSTQYEYYLTTGQKATGRPYSYLVSPQYVPEIMEKLSSSLKEHEMRAIGFSGIGDQMYSDYRKKNIARNESGDFVIQALEMVRESTDSVLLQGAYAYAFPYADVITDVPVYSSKYDVEDAEIPFLPMVLGGAAALYSEPVNLVGNVRDMLLRTVEFGVSPTFFLMNADKKALKDTDYLNYYAISYEDWKETIQEVSSEMELLSDVRNEKIIHHEVLTDNIRITTYESGKKVYVNYSERQETVGGVVVPAKGFVVEGGK